MHVRNVEMGEEDPGTRRSDALTVVHVLAPAAVGGLERVVRLLAVEQGRAGHRVHVVAVVSPGEEDHPFAAAARADGVDVHVLVVGVRAYVREYRLVRALFSRLRADVVHTHGFRPDVVDSAAARSLGIGTVSTIHGFTRISLRGRVYEWLQRRSTRWLDAVIAVSAPQVEEIVAAGTPRERVHLVPNAWPAGAERLPREEARRRLGIEPGEFVAGWVGRLGPEKGPDVLVEACAHLSGTDIRVSVIGDGALNDELRTRAGQAGLTDTIRWHGAVSDAGSMFEAFDVFVLSSRTEGTPMVLFEAMAAGVPVVATRVGGVPDVLTEAEARLVPSGDARALAAAIRDVRFDPSAASRRAEAARARLARVYAVDPWIGRHTEIYRELGKAEAGGHVPVGAPSAT